MRRLYRARLKARRDAEYRLDIATETGLKRGLEQGLEKGLKKGREEGIFEAKHSDLIRLLDLKYSLTEKEKAFVLSVKDLESLNSALDKIIVSDSKDQVLGVLKKPEK